MQLSPVYGADAIISLDTAPGAVAVPALRQRRRLVSALAALDADQWNHASRCEGWSVRDVIVHLDSTNTFWTFSIQAGLGGQPTQFLASFDPVRSPAELVAGSRDTPAAQVLEKFAESTSTLTELWESLGEEDWSAIAEAPPGHLSVDAVTHHALWDSWIHERDVLHPLGVESDTCDDEVLAALSYAAALGPALAASRGRPGRAAMALEVTDPDARLVIDIADRVRVGSSGGVDGAEADLTLRGDAVALVEGLSIRRPLEQSVPDDRAWMLAGLAEAFDNSPG